MGRMEPALMSKVKVLLPEALGFRLRTLAVRSLFRSVVRYDFGFHPLGFGFSVSEV